MRIDAEKVDAARFEGIDFIEICDCLPSIKFPRSITDSAALFAWWLGTEFVRDPDVIDG